ncbi:hypothetical protein LWC35_16045 [Pseudonocardia kujensis]|uniref:hypothetical protein n=1 Tax=Pseudonocardia kujensis TaxID=1128675 RepID=UPI001E4A23AB|nr:hypothetical protein [Pseudonocardia kujensis]MCE0764408.1 hypothetical protein [Pseudonocardia kujensis]
MPALPGSHEFVENSQYGKTRRQLDRELAQARSEISRSALGIEDQRRRAGNLREARGQLN